MYMVILTILIVGITAYIWSARGFFSALIHMMCVIAAGAIAFGVWEPVSMLLLNQSGDRGMGSVLGGMAWGLGLGVPFALALALLRAGIDKLLPANAQCDSLSDYIGGGVCGLISGVISAGIMLLSIGYLRVGPDFGMYRPVVFTGGTARGSLQKSPDNFAPWADKITARIYSTLSTTTLRTGEPLAKWRPDLETEGPALRTTYDKRSRTTFKPDAFKFLGWYTVGDEQRGSKLGDLTRDSWIDNPQKFTDLEGEDLDKQSGLLDGFIIQFNSHAREKTGQVVVGNGQVRLVIQSKEDDDDCRAIHPVSVVTNVDDPTKVEYARFRFNSDETYFSSVGGAAEATMAFEFPVPFGYTPLALYVKGVRIDISEQPKPTNYPDPASRDAVIQQGTLQGMGGIGPIIGPDGNPVQAQQQAAFSGPTFITSNILGVVIQKGTEQGLTVAEEGRGWSVRDGQTQLFKDRLKNMTGGGLEPKLQINRFSTTDDTVVVQVDITPTHRSLEDFQKIDASDKNGDVVLVDTNGVKYPAVGFIYDDAREFHLRFTKGQPVKLKDAPSVSLSTPDRKLKLVFVVSLGVEIREFKIGNTQIEPYDPPKKCDQKQR